MNDISKRLLSEIQKTGMSYRELSEKTGLPKSAIQRYAVGETDKIPIDRLELIARALGTSAAYLMGWESEPATFSLPSNVTPISEMHMQRVPMLGEIAAGVPIMAEEDYETFVDTPIRCDFALTVRGDSMEPTYLNGDVVYIRRQDDVDEGQVAAVVVDGDATLKHVYHIRNGVQLVSDNPRYSPMIFTLPDCDSIRILGKVMGYTRMYGSKREASEP